MAEVRFNPGDVVESTRPNNGSCYRWMTGMVIFVVPTGVSPYALYTRWLRDKGICKFKRSEDSLFFKERYIVRVERDGKFYFYCPVVSQLRLAGDLRVT